MDLFGLREHTDFAKGIGPRLRHANTQTECTLTVNAKPKIEYEDRLKDGITAKAGASLILLVNISGFPKPKVSWYHNGDEVTGFTGVDIDFDHDQELVHKIQRNQLSWVTTLMLDKMANQEGNQ